VHGAGYEFDTTNRQHDPGRGIIQARPSREKTGLDGAKKDRRQRKILAQSGYPDCEQNGDGYDRKKIVRINGLVVEDHGLHFSSLVLYAEKQRLC
jgi:hypothetical protein